ncbi:MAG TPA: UDP-N-acetylmuramoyl-L-alanyl-D-glutamate--2,6-diaminopimelate ligase [Pyrinomonadaceae bacterium]|nr:UDP-N-acetylmuramoyl-L-alanyl-D-glutamate--2,6-diaminopimelate ligase [Chloracidobacterium sp.]HBE83356.1 UDP-N-acetylmuramoyl-L-alanyl-D-glutamate--2,6-diaminopimelate ligase [Blastocatellia bacterium]HRJ89540.1 UDP-N-acetylmuramoyl-L-alanyl-D-glutamate--2,6-diaminopimelate ligase [Pyrinomonadaceae bacterium]HRK50819.1 UDP-N-acetylmuramoyl-L-alanyl-D-glutamate--2,6-diaminopimelate ligase [Pyrinomonadaceae bacterium]
MSIQETNSRSLSDDLGAIHYGSTVSRTTDVTHDSRQVREGTLFVAIKGATVDGHRFIEDVMRRGAAGIISEYDPPEAFEGIWLKVSDARVALAKSASIINGHPSHKLDLVGVTGTNGKTTTTYLCYALAEASGVKSAMLTTVEYRIGERSEEAIRTTPEASDTNRFLRHAVDEGCGFAAMEASSQAIDLHRCDWLRFKIAVFTNLTQDHLDYHLTMENYFDAKKKLFDGRLGEKPASSVINIDDEWGSRLADELKAAGQRVVTISQDAARRFADLTAENVMVSLLKGTSFLLKTPEGERTVISPLVGRPHVYNMLAASATALELGYSLEDIVNGLSKCIGAPGRFERVQHDGDFAVVVDYAHTDDALLNTLRTAKELTKGRVITVFGCGGDRDKTKRKPMGRAAGSHSDIAIITSDNPRTEDPLKIMDEIESGLKETGTEYLSISDRREAINKAISLASPGDVVIIAGKGHENYQIIGSDKFHFDDREVALAALEALKEI